MASEPLQPAIAPLVALRQEGGFAERLLGAVEARLDAERDQLGLWAPVALGTGILAWFALPALWQWQAALALALAITAAGYAIGFGRRAGMMLGMAGLFGAAGLLLAWGKASWVAAPVLARPVVMAFNARIERVEDLAARDQLRLTLAPAAADLPSRIRVNVPADRAAAGLEAGAHIRLRARLMPPAHASLPGGYDFAQRAWFQRIGATGRLLGEVEILDAPAPSATPLRRRLDRHIRAAVGGDAGAVASALVTGEQGAISEAGAQAMRRSGLAHLLSVSGLHLTAVAAGTMWLVMRLLALSPALALRVRLPLVAAGAGAAAAIFYTWLTGAEVPTVRSCAAALLVLAALVAGRDALTLRLVAAGALLVMLFWPEAVAGPSFQLSFAAVVTIVALHESRSVRRWFARREEAWPAKAVRALGAMLLTGMAVELALMPIALLHFHKAGVYGALANLVAIPLTTFVIMPLEAAALALDLIGLGQPFWRLTGLAMGGLLSLAHGVAGLPGSAAMVPAMPALASALIMGGGLWLALWRTAWRQWGLAAVAIGVMMALTSPVPDLLISGDGRHVAARGSDGTVGLLRARAGDYTQDQFAEASGVDGELSALDTMHGARCSADSCDWLMQGAGRTYRVLATRSSYSVVWRQLIAACAKADIVISERMLPQRCQPRWLKADARLLRQSGGLAIRLADPPILRTVIRSGESHYWWDPPTVMPARALSKVRTIK